MPPGMRPAGRHSSPRGTIALGLQRARRDADQKEIESSVDSDAPAQARGGRWPASLSAELHKHHTRKPLPLPVLSGSCGRAEPGPRAVFTLSATRRPSSEGPWLCVQILRSVCPYRGWEAQAHVRGALESPDNGRRCFDEIGRRERPTRAPRISESPRRQKATDRHLHTKTLGQLPGESNLVLEAKSSA